MQIDTYPEKNIKKKWKKVVQIVLSLVYPSFQDLQVTFKIKIKKAKQQFKEKGKFYTSIFKKLAK